MYKTRIIAALILISNTFFFIPETVKVIRTDGGIMGFGWIVFPFLIFINLFIIPAFLSFINKFKDSEILFWINQICLVLIALSFGYILRSNGH